MYIRDAIINAERSVQQLISKGFNAQEMIPGVITLEQLQSLLLVATQAQKLMTFTANDGEEKVVVVRGFGRDYARSMNTIRKNMGPNEKGATE